MARQARVISIDALLTMQAALARFERDLRAALDDLEMEVRRALQWIQQDAPQYWQQEVRQGWERVAEARVQLQQAMTMRRVAEHDPSCVEEKKRWKKPDAACNWPRKRPKLYATGGTASRRR